MMLKKIIQATALTSSLVYALTGPSWAAVKGDTVVAKVNDKTITAADLAKIEGTLPPELVKAAKEKDSEKFHQGLVNQAVDMHLLLEAAKKSGVDQKEDVKKALEQAKEQVVVQAYVSEQLKDRVGDKELRKKFEEFLKKGFDPKAKERKVRHIMVDTKQKAEEIIQKLKSGSDFQKLARELSGDKATAQEGGDLGYIRENDLPADFKPIFSIAPGSYTEQPVKASLGGGQTSYHVFKVEDERTVKPPKFEEVKEQLTAAVFQEAMKDLLQRLKDPAKIERFTTDGKPISPTTAPSNEKEASSAKEDSGKAKAAEPAK